MIVDDDRTTCSLLQTLLELDGFEVVLVNQGGEVLAAATEQKPDLILMDYYLSDVKGIDILKGLREQPDFADLPIVMTSGLDVQAEVMVYGATDFLPKPFEPSHLPILFNKLIDG